MFSSSISSMQKTYQAVVVEGKWGSLEKFLDDDEAFSIAYPTMTVAKDTAFHIAVHSKSEKPLKQILDRFANCDEQILTNMLNTTNAYENTVLHEAAINHNIKAVKLLVEGRPVTPDQQERGYVNPQQLLERNKPGQTPLFKAAAFGSTKVVKYLASQPNQTIDSAGYKKLEEAHRIKDEGFSILHAAVQGEHFGTALELLKLDQGLAKLKTKNGMTSLHLLTNLRYAFTNKFSGHLGLRLLYHCIPTGDDNYDDADNIFDSEVDQNDGEVGDNQNPSPQGNISNPTSDNQNGDRLIIIEVGDSQNPSFKWKIKAIIKSFWNYFIKDLETINKSFWNCFIKDSRWPTAREIWVEKRKLKFAFELARKLIENDHSWDLSYTEDTTVYYRSSPGDKPSTDDVSKQVLDQKEPPSLPESSLSKQVLEQKEPPSLPESSLSKQVLEQKEPPSLPESSSPSTDVTKQVLDQKEPPSLPESSSPSTDVTKQVICSSPSTDVPKQVFEIIEELLISIEEEPIKVETPLLAATRRGVIELVKEILKKHPQAVEHVSHKKQNILHVAASYRRREIFELVQKMEIPTRRLIMGIDEDGYTVLHHVADTTNCPGGTRPGPAYQLQDELEWFQRVQKIMPSYFTQHLNNRDQTAQELFREKHETQLKAAQGWIKETSQSCSGVAVLVSTVVFAAAFTVPGGTRDDNGLPILIYSPFFMFFTVMDVVSLSCSLTAVVMFLSIVTSPFELHNFRVTLPRRLTLGFALLFMSVATTMLAFTSTIILIIRSDLHRQWTLTLICCAAFVPVSVLALTNFPLFVSFIKAWNYLIALPCSSLLRILMFLGKLVHQRGLCRFLNFLRNLVRQDDRFLNFLRNLVRQDDRPRLEDERNV